MKKNNFLKGAFILTAAGVITRILGFIFRVYLSRTIGSQGVGLYQLVLPISAICYGAGIAGLEVSVSRFTALYQSSGRYKASIVNAIMCTCISLSLSILSCVIVNIFSGQIARYIFHNYACRPLICILSYSIPFSCIHAMISSYYIGKEQASVPAVSQLFEQLVRICSVAVIVGIYKEQGRILDASVGIKGLLAGEIGSSILCVSIIALKKKRLPHILASGQRIEIHTMLKDIMSTSAPVSMNRLMLHIMQSVEIALIPLMLQMYGYSYNAALSLLGIVAGMALPVILFPSTLTNAISQMLLPDVSKLQDNPSMLKKRGHQAFCFSSIFGIICILVLILAGAPLAALIFHEKQLARFIRLIAWVCPFIYLTTTYKSMLHALGQTARVFANNMLCEIFNMLCIVLLIPRFGITAYTFGLLISQIINSILNITHYNHYVKKAVKKS